MCYTYHPFRIIHLDAADAADAAVAADVQGGLVHGQAAAEWMFIEPSSRIGVK